MATTRHSALWLAASLAGWMAAGPAASADLARSRQVVNLVYDVGLYTAELDRAIGEAEGKGVFGGKGSSQAGRVRDRDLTRRSMLGQRDAVLRATTEWVAARTSDTELRALQAVAGGETAADPALVDHAVATIKASFNDALWAQMSRVARGNAEFPCRQGNRSWCQ